MSDDERELDLDSDEEAGLDYSNLPPGQDKRAHHNALERKRRDHIKDSFSGLKDAIPTLQVRIELSRLQQIFSAGRQVQPSPDTQKSQRVHRVHEVSNCRKSRTSRTTKCYRCGSRNRSKIINFTDSAAKIFKCSLLPLIIKATC